MWELHKKGEGNDKKLVFYSTNKVQIFIDLHWHSSAYM
jgi:hypothetical protein